MGGYHIHHHTPADGQNMVMEVSVNENDENDPANYTAKGRYLRGAGLIAQEIGDGKAIPLEAARWKMAAPVADFLRGKYKSGEPAALLGKPSTTIACDVQRVLCLLLLWTLFERALGHSLFYSFLEKLLTFSYNRHSNITPDFWEMILSLWKGGNYH